jgi:hypothetical protein
MVQQRAFWWREKLLRSGFLLSAILFHLILFMLLATLVIFPSPAPPLKAAEFQAVHIAVPAPPPAPPSAGDAARAASEPQLVQVPPTAPPQTISTVASSSFSFNASKIMAPTFSHLSLPPPQSTGMTQGSGGAVAGAGADKVSFFGLQSQGKHIAFLLDYSGSMEGAFRTTMEHQLEESLTDLPAGTQVMLICWAGPAWSYTQTAHDIAKDWKMIKTYDNFKLRSGVRQEPPQWVDINPGTVADIMKGIKAQVSDPGGTDWRQPFRYAMKADPPPDVIFFLTDGQIPAATADRALTDIATSILKANSHPTINCLWIQNPREKSDVMEKLAKQYQGEFRRVSVKAN